MTKFPCPYLNASVELTHERELHIAQHHPDLLPQYRNQLAETLADPDQVRRSRRMEDARLFSRWYDMIGGGKYVVVVVITDENARRNWVVTAYMTRRMAGGEIEWKRS
jgi:hypothetical protein